MPPIAIESESTNLKLCKMETKLQLLETKVIEVESSCNSISNERDKQRKELDSTKTEIKKMKMSCNNIEQRQQEYLKDKEHLNGVGVSLDER